MAKVSKPKFIQVDASALGELLSIPTVSAPMELLFVDWAFDQYASWCRENGKRVSITRAEIAFPGPFLKIVANRRSFYFAWDADRACGVPIARSRYPRSSAVDSSVTVVPTPTSASTIGAVRRSLLGRLGIPESH